MAQNSLIEWTDATWNTLAAFDKATGKRGWFCTRVSEGCKHCYAAVINVRLGNGHDYQLRNLDKIEWRLVNLSQPLAWKKPLRIFVNSMTDLFHESVPDELIDQVFAVMALADRHTFQILTKRPARMLAYFADEFRWAMIEGAAQKLYHERTGEDPSMWLAVHGPLKNVILGVSVENQAAGDERFSAVCELGEAGWHTMVSLEPLLGPVTIPQRYLALGNRGWCVPGFESGRNARPGNALWIRAIRDQAIDAGVPLFFKQWGEFLYFAAGSPCLRFDGKQHFARVDGTEYRGAKVRFLTPDGAYDPTADWAVRVGKKRAGATIDGTEWHEFPRVSR